MILAVKVALNLNPTNQPITSLPYDMFTPLPNHKILDMTKLKAFADNKLNIAKMMISLFERAENAVGKKKLQVPSVFLLL